MGFVNCPLGAVHYNDIIMGTMASQITSLTIVYSTVYSVADQRKHQSSASLVNSPHKWPVARKIFPFEDVIMLTDVSLWLSNCIPSSSVDIITFSSPELSGFFYLFPQMPHTVYPKKYAHGFVVLCFVVVMQSFIMNSLEVFIHIHQGCFAGTGAIVRLPQCQWSKPDGYGKISQCITTTKHSKAKTVCIFLGIYCICASDLGQYWLDNDLAPVRFHTII